MVWFTKVSLTNNIISKERFSWARAHASNYLLDFSQLNAPRAVHFNTSNRELTTFSLTLAPPPAFTPSIHENHYGFPPLPQISYPFNFKSGPFYLLYASQTCLLLSMVTTSAQHTPNWSFLPTPVLDFLILLHTTASVVFLKILWPSSLLK